MKRKKIAALLMIGVMLVSAAGCAKKGPEDNSAKTAELMEDPQWEAAMTDPFEKYPETVKVTLGRTSTDYAPLQGTEYEGDDDSNNAWTRYAKEKMNVDCEFQFIANDGEDYNQKVSMALVDGKIPDILTVGDYETLKQLYENDMIADLTEVYENCASDKIKEIYDSYEGRCLESATFNGKLMALPTTEISHGPGVLWLRKDWMDKLNLQEPKTIEDMEHILQEFIDKDPGGNGSGKTVGLVMSSDVAGTSGGAYMVNNIFGLYGAYPKQWLDDGSGNAVYGSVQPEMKEALARLSDWYQKGLIDKQLAVRTTDDCKALLTSGQSGAFLDNWWGSWTVADTMKLNPEAEWVPYVCPVNENGEVQMFSGNPNSSYVVVRKGFEHPELAAKLLSYQFDYARYQDNDPESMKELNDYASRNVESRLIYINIDYYDAFERVGGRIQKALETGDESVLYGYDKNDYQNFKSYLEKVEKGEATETYEWGGYTSSIVARNVVAEANLKVTHPIFFGNTASMTLKWPTLEKMEQEMYLKIITGEESVDYFDTFVENWKKTGGDQITEEVNQAVKEK